MHSDVAGGTEPLSDEVLQSDDKGHRTFTMETLT